MSKDTITYYESLPKDQRPKRVEIQGSVYRWRRGKLVKIPDEWVGKTVHQQTIRKRQSKQDGKKRKMERTTKQSGYIPPLPTRKTEQDAAIVEGLEELEEE